MGREIAGPDGKRLSGSKVTARSIAFAAMCAVAILALASCVNPLLKLKAPAVAPPTISPGGGVFGTDQSVSLSDASNGVSIYYTTDGTTPTTSSAKYSVAIPVAGNGTKEVIEAIAVSGGKTSGVVEATFTINYSIGGTGTLASPTFSPSAGVFSAAPTGGVALSGPSGASIYYTTNGSTPSASNGTLYSGPVSIANTNLTTTTVKAVSVESGFISSPVVSSAYEINFTQVSTPQLSVAAGSYTSDQTNILITVPSAPTGTTIYYTLTSGATGAVPTTSSPVFSSTTPLSVTGNGTVDTIEAMATAPGYAPSTVALATYIISYPQVSSPSFNVTAGVYPSNQTVTISDATSGATIYYTTNGTTPTTSSSSGPASGVSVPVSGSDTGAVATTINAIAVKTGMTTSAEASATYTVNYTADTVTPTISISPTGSGNTESSDGTHITATANPTITLAGGTASTTYYYSWAVNTTPSAPSLTGSSVTAASGGAFPVTSYGGGAATTLTVEAFAVDPGTAPGTTTSETFTINAQAAAPTYTPTAARYSSNQTLTVTDSTPGATVYATVIPDATSVASAPSSSSYTTSGSPSATYSLTGPLQSYAMEAVATAPGYVSSSYVSTPTTQPFIIVAPRITETTPGAYTFTLPQGLSSLSVTAKLWGAGGSGGTTAYGGPGGTGGGGGYAETTVQGLSAAGGTSFTVDVGAGGVPTTNGGTGGGESDFYVTQSGAKTFEAVAGGGGGGGDGTAAFTGSRCTTIPSYSWSGSQTIGGAGGAGGQGGGSSSVENFVVVTYALIGCALPATTTLNTSAGGGGVSPGGGAPGSAGGNAGGSGAPGGSGPQGSGGVAAALGGSGGQGYGGGGGGGNAYYSGTPLSTAVPVGGGGGGGGDNFGTLTEAGNQQAPANTGSVDYSTLGIPAGGGGAAGAAGYGGSAVIYLN